MGNHTSFVILLTYFEETTVQKLRETFHISKVEESIFKYVGLNIVNCASHIEVSQDEFIKNMEPIALTASRQSQKTSKLTHDETGLLRSLVGQANWVASQTRPDICYKVLELSMCLSRQPEVRHLIQANKFVRKIKADCYKLIFPSMDDINNLKIVTYSDAAHANLPDGASSTAGYITFLADGTHSSVISWRSSKIKRIVRSSTAAESLALSDALDDALYLREVFAELLGKTLQIFAYIDNKNLHSVIHSTTAITEKRLRIEVAAIKEMIARKEISVRWVPTTDQLADSLTKRGSHTRKLIDVLTFAKLSH